MPHTVTRIEEGAEIVTPTTAPTPVIERTEGSFRPPPAPNLPVKQGPAPLAYIVEAGGTIRIADAETGATIAEAVAALGASSASTSRPA